MTQHLDLDALQALAEAATPGPWRECGHDRGGCSCAQVWSTAVDFPVATAFKNDEEMGHAPIGQPEANAAYIAAANPAVILALIDRLRKAEAAALAIQDLIDSHKRDTHGECDEACDIVAGMEAARDAVLAIGAGSK